MRHSGKIVTHLLALILPAAAAAAQLQVERSGAFTVRGAVVDPDGRPLADVPIGQTYPSVDVLARTGADGTFAVTVERTYYTRLLIAGERWARLSVALPRDGELGQATVEPAGALTGWVRDEAGAPIAAARVWVSDPLRGGERWFHHSGPPNDVYLSAETKTDERGRFVLRGVPRVHCAVSARASGFESATLGAAPDKPVELTLRGRAPRPKAAPRARPACRVRAVDDATGAPIPDFQAGLYWPGASLAAMSFRAAVAMEDPVDGVVTTDVLSTRRVEVRAPGYARARRDVLDGELVVRLRPESGIRGVVRDPKSGAPVAGAAVRVAIGAVPDEKSSTLREEAPVEAVTGADGRFRLRGLPAEACSLVATHPERLAGPHVVVRLADGEHRRDVELESPAGGKVDVRIGGRVPDPRWRIRLWPEPPPGQFSTAWFTDVSGQRPITQPVTRIHGLPAGNHRVELLLPQPPRLGEAYRVKVANVRVDADQVATGGVTRLDLALDEVGPREVTGALRFPHATPRAIRLMVAFERNEPSNMMHWSLFLGGAFARVSTDGRFTAPVEPGEHTLLVVDIVTKVVLAKVTPVKVEAGREAQDLGEVQVAARALDVTLVGDDAERRNVGSVEVRVGDLWPSGVEFMMKEPAATLARGIAAPVQDGRLAIETWIPSGPVTLTACTIGSPGEAVGTVELPATTTGSAQATIRLTAPERR